jgi:DsbC/DsbD-like thiol-disulfide interchange protein
MMLRMEFGSPAILAMIVFCLADLPSARAQDASAWETVPHGAARLIAGAAHESTDGAWLRAGAEIRLAPGWHTYWRYPGASGVPPRFDFTGSENVKTVSVLWPAPVVFADGAAGRSIGYIEHVVFPLRVVARDASKPALLRLNLGYAICRELCQPAEANLTLALPVRANATAHDATLAAAEARVPRSVGLDENAAFGVRSVHREADDERRVVVEVAAPEGLPIDLLVEGPTPDWALPLPKPIAPKPGSAPNVHRFAFALDGLPSGAQAAGAMLRFTLVSPADAVEAVSSLR